MQDQISEYQEGTETLEGKMEKSTRRATGYTKYEHTREYEEYNRWTKGRTTPKVSTINDIRRQYKLVFAGRKTENPMEFLSNCQKEMEKSETI